MKREFKSLKPIFAEDLKRRNDSHRKKKKLYTEIYKAVAPSNTHFIFAMHFCTLRVCVIHARDFPTCACVCREIHNRAVIKHEFIIRNAPQCTSEFAQTKSPSLFTTVFFLISAKRFDAPFYTILQVMRILLAISLQLE